jgi:hypothetical protein
MESHLLYEDFKTYRQKMYIETSSVKPCRRLCSETDRTTQVDTREVCEGSRAP